MKIEKILNNNAVICLNDKGQEYIVAGRGLAFRLQEGDVVNESKVQLTFDFANRDIITGFIKVVTEIPLEYIVLSDRIIRYAKETYAKRLDDSIYITLTEHIFRVIGRQSYGFQLKNALRWEIRHIYREEFLIGKKALFLLQRQCMLDLSEDEAAFIALHFVNAELNGNLDHIVDVTRVIQGILQIVKAHYQIVEYNEESVNYSRLITHLKYLGQRMFNDKQHASNNNDEMFDMMKTKYDDAYACVKKVKTMLEAEFDYTLSEEEQLYLIIHIVKVIQDK